MSTALEHVVPRDAHPRRAAGEESHVVWSAAAVAFVVGFLAHAATLGHGFVWDDLILLDQKIRFYAGVRDVFFEPAGLPGFHVYRPLTFGSYWLDQLVWSRDPLGFHLTSVLLHALNCALLYVLACALGCGSWPALWAALAFAVHPMHTEAVAWVACRADLLAAAFAILAVLAFLRYRARGGPAALAAVLGTAFATVASKETGVAVPFILLAAEYARPMASANRHTRARRTLTAVAAAAAGVLAYWALRPDDRSVGLSLAAFDLAGLAHLFGAFGFYVERTLVPLGLTAYMPEPPGGPRAILFALLGVAGIVFLVTSRQTPGSLRRFGTLWFLLTLAPALLVAITEMLVTRVSERYLYLPSVGLGLLLAAEIARRPRWARTRIAAVAMTTALLVLALTTAARDRLWRDEIDLWSAVTAQETRFSLPYMNLALALAEADRLDEAERAYRTALEKRASDDTRRNTLINLGHLKLRQGDLDAAEAFFAQTIAIAPHATAYYGLGVAARQRARAHLDAGEPAEASAEFARAREALTAALALAERHYKSHFVLGSVLYQTGDLAGALRHYQRVVELAADTDTGRDAAEAVTQLTAWLSDPAHRPADGTQAGGGP